MPDVLTTLVLVVVVVIVWLAIVEVRRDGRQKLISNRTSRLARLQNSVRSFPEDEYRGDRLFVDKLVARRLAEKRARR